jgi:hypothetical protein
VPHRSGTRRAAGRAERTAALLARSELAEAPPATADSVTAAALRNAQWIAASHDGAAIGNPGQRPTACARALSEGSIER